MRYSPRGKLHLAELDLERDDPAQSSRSQESEQLLPANEEHDGWQPIRRRTVPEAA
jgi:hypothetical protein